jgi:hypothetical protein
MWYNERKHSLPNISSLPRKEFMSFLALLPDLPGCSVEQVSQTEEAILITVLSTYYLSLMSFSRKRTFLGSSHGMRNELTAS